MPSSDRLYKLFFSFARMVEDLLRGFVREDWVDQLDFSTLEKTNASYVSRELQERSDDAVWRLKGPQGDVYVYILLEFQSSDDRFMALRLLGYVALLYQDLQRRHELSPAGKLPPVVPIVPYNGLRPWSASLEMAELVEHVSPGLTRYSPSLRYLLIDENRLAEQDLAAAGNLVAALFRLQRSQGPEEVQEVVTRLVEWLAPAEHQELRRVFAHWLSVSLLPLKMPGTQVPKVEDLQEFKAMIDEQMVPWTEQWKQQGFLLGMEKGMEQGLERGMERGLRQGEAQVLLRQLTRKFGNLDAKVQARIENADADQLLEWAERLLTAEAIADVWG